MSTVADRSVKGHQPVAMRRVAVVGVGERSFVFLKWLLNNSQDKHQLVAFCDANPRMLERAVTRVRDAGGGAVSTYPHSDYGSMLQQARPDVVLVCTPDLYHATYTIQALEAGCDVIVEKPLAIDAEQCRRVDEAARRSTGRVIVAFNCRYMPWAVQIKRLLQQDVIGRVVSVSVEWMLDARKGAMYFTRWHSQKAYSAGLLVHKATHHFDLVNWWLDRVPRRVYATGRRAFFGDDHRDEFDIPPADPSYLRADHSADPFFPPQDKIDAWRSFGERPDDQLPPHPGRSVWRSGDMDIEDTMSVVVEYSRGVALTYTLNAYLPRAGRHIVINGTRGRLEYHHDTNGVMAIRRAPAQASPPADAAPVRWRPRLIVQPLFGEAHELPLPTAEGEHDGADPLMLSSLFASRDVDSSLGQLAGDRQGAASALIGIAANQSIAESRPVDIEALAPWTASTERLSSLG